MLKDRKSCHTDIILYVTNININRMKSNITKDLDTQIRKVVKPLEESLIKKFIKNKTG